MRNEPILQFTHVDKFYSDKRVLNNISFSVYKNEIIALLGVNGAGKTTAIKMMLGQEVPSHGSVSLFNLNPKNYLARHKVGLTPQNVEFPEAIKTKEILEFVHSHYTNPHSIELMIKTFELNSFLDVKGSKLSGGQKRRLALALAFVGNPEIIFLDEPTTGLDVAARKILWEYIKREAKTGKTIFLTTHYLEEIEQIVSRVIFLQNGCISIDGTVDEVKKMASTSFIKISFTLEQDFDFSSFKYCEKASRQENKYILQTYDRDNLLRELVHHNIPFKNLDIQHENLETAFLNLSNSMER